MGIALGRIVRGLRYMYCSKFRAISPERGAFPRTARGLPSYCTWPSPVLYVAFPRTVRGLPPYCTWPSPVRGLPPCCTWPSPVLYVAFPRTVRGLPLYCTWPFPVLYVAFPCAVRGLPLSRLGPSTEHSIRASLEGQQKACLLAMGSARSWTSWTKPPHESSRGTLPLCLQRRG